MDPSGYEYVLCSLSTHRTQTDTHLHVNVHPSREEPDIFLQVATLLIDFLKRGNRDSQKGLDTVHGAEL